MAITKMYLYRSILIILLLIYELTAQWIFTLQKAHFIPFITYIGMN